MSFRRQNSMRKTMVRMYWLLHCICFLFGFLLWCGWNEMKWNEMMDRQEKTQMHRIVTKKTIANNWKWAIRTLTFNVLHFFITNLMISYQKTTIIKKRYENDYWAQKTTHSIWLEKSSLKLHHSNDFKKIPWKFATFCDLYNINSYFSCLSLL